MKKLLTILFALTLLSGLSYGAGNKFTWTGAGLDGKWTTAANWTKAALPYGEAGGTSTWPGEFETGDYAFINTGAAPEIITDVPTITLGRLEVTFVDNTNIATEVELYGASDGVTITMRTPSAELVAENTFWVVKIEELSRLSLNFSGARVKMVCQPRAHFWQKNGSIFNPADFTDCDNQKGFILQATASLHAEYIQQENTDQAIKGWIQYVFDNSKHHFFSPPITSTWPLDAEYSQIFCRKHNTICVFEGDYVRKYINGTSWDNWMGNCTPILTNPAINWEPGRGYQYYGNPGNATDTYEVYGIFNSQSAAGPVTLPITSTGWNFVGNPFPSAITFGEPSGAPTAGVGWTWDLTKIYPVAYYWDNALNGGLGGYHYYNWYTGVGNGPVDERRLLARSQGFFVDVVTVDPITLGNRARVFRGVFQIGKSEVSNYLTFGLSSNGSQVDDAIIGFRSDASGTDFNGLFDSRKLFNDNADLGQIYFKTTDDQDVAVKTLEAVSGNVMFPMYFKANSNGTYSLNAQTINSFAANTGITLKDNKTNTTVDLKVNPVYTFEATAGEDDARFSLYFSNVAYGLNDLAANTFKVFSSNNTIQIYTNDININGGNVFVYDMIGKQMIQDKLNGSITTINTNLSKGFYVVSVRTDKGTYNQKVYIN